MKKVLLSLGIIFIAGNLMSYKDSNIENEIIVGRKCVDKAMERVELAAATTGDGDLNGAYFNEYMAVYHFYYRECMLGNI